MGNVCMVGGGERRSRAVHPPTQPPIYPLLACPPAPHPPPHPQEMEAISGTKGCAYCGGLGHRVTDCPKLRADTREQGKKQQDRFGGNPNSSGFGAEM